MNYDGKVFRSISNSENGEVDESVLFVYQQLGNVLTCTYAGKQILSGHLIGIVSEDGRIEMRYHQVNKQGNLMTGICWSNPEILSDGRVRLHENWQWTCENFTKGTSILEELLIKK